jgi:glycosyltransferase involved in cell wall biosynthesis
MAKVVHLTSVHKRNDTRIFYKECLSLSKKYSSVYLVLNDGLGDEVKNLVNIIDLGIKSGNRLVRMTKVVYSLYKKALNLDANIYHFHDPELLLVGLLLKIKGKKVIYDVHEDVPRQILSKTWIPKILRKIISFLFNTLEKNIAKYFDAIITATPFIYNIFTKYNKNTYAINNYPILKTTNYNEYFWEKKKKSICYIGGITKIRGLKNVIKSLKNIDCKLVLGGFFSNKFFEERLKSLEEWKKVNYKGFLNRKEVYDVFKYCLAGLVTFLPEPNHINSQPNKMFEYMSAGLPVICSNFKLWKDIVEGSECGICVNPLDPKEIAEAIRFILENPEKAKKMGENGLKAVKEKYNWEKEEKKLLEVYSKL